MNDNSKKLANGSWSDTVEDLVDRGNVEGSISVLQCVVSNLGTVDSSADDLRLATALGDLANLHSPRSLSLKADELRPRALLLRTHAPNSRDSETLEVKKASKEEDEEGRVSNPLNDRQEEDDDWEAIADSAVSGEALLSSQQEERVSSSPSVVDPSPQGTPKRRGRGSFLYQKSCLYSDLPDVVTSSRNNSGSEDEVEGLSHRLEDGDDQVRNLRFGTGHALILSDFSPTTRTIDLEKLFDNFRDRGFAIRWVNDTTALAVFRTSSIAREAQSSIHYPFKVRQLDEEDDLLTKISSRDLEPPFPRPKTSARTAQRLIAHGIGMKFSTDFGSSELRKQEEARKNRIIARQTMKDDAWGSDKQ